MVSIELLTWLIVICFIETLFAMTYTYKSNDHPSSRVVKNDPRRCGDQGQFDVTIVWRVLWVACRWFQPTQLIFPPCIQQMHMYFTGIFGYTTCSSNQTIPAFAFY